MQISVQAVKELRERSGAGIMECKRALEEMQGDMEKASDLLKRQGLAKAEKRAGRATSQGLIEVYVHGGGRIGAMVEMNCETDFVARTNEFKELAHNVAMQIAATSPLYVGPEDMPQGGESPDPKQACLLLQPYIREPSRTVQDIVTETIAKVGENIRVSRFARFELGS